MSDVLDNQGGGVFDYTYGLIKVDFPKVSSCTAASGESESRKESVRTDCQWFPESMGKT